MNLISHKHHYSFRLFYIGLFLLPSAFSLAIILILIATILGCFNSKVNYFNDKWNYPFLISGIFMIISTIVHTFFNKHLTLYDLDSSLSWIGLANWIPFFWCFWGFKIYIESPENRKICGIALLSGTFPVLITGLGQSLFNWDGPFETLYGLIVWYQRPLESITGLTGLFNNPNYTGTWLNIVWPFCIACILDSETNFVKNLATYIFTFGISFCVILTNSRAAWISILIGILMMYGRKSFKFLRNLLLILLVLISSTIFSIFGTKFQFFLKSLIPQSIWMEFSNFQYTRLEIWESAIKIIINNPLFGTGAASFPNIFEAESGLWKGHTHNLPLELILSYGILPGLLITLPIIYLIFLSIREIIYFKTSNLSIYDKAWVSSLFLLFLSQLVDVQYFDGRISIIGWILLCGARNILTCKSISKELNADKII